jgi:hypothetical protein
MMRPLRTLLALAAATVVAVAAAIPALASPAAPHGAAAAAAGPRGALTAAEYRQLVAEQLAFRQLRHKRPLTWNDLYAACHKVGQSTRLLQSVRSNCETGVGIAQSLGSFTSDFLRCQALTATTTTTGTTATPTGTGTATGTTTTSTGTTTTGTTTTGTTITGSLSATDIKLLACLQPAYAVIGRATRSVYVSQTALRRQVLARHFVGRCLLTLAPTVAELHVLDRFAVSAKQLAADVALITQTASAQGAPDPAQAVRIERDAARFSAEGRAFEHLHRPQKLGVCPHQ